uniref:serine/threonine-protein kinase n=1 Tax=Allorhizocola rhizosphaerae TaxID=1872709 RepID=UPI0013C32530
MDETEHTPLDRPDITGPLPGYRLRAQLARTGMSEVFRAEEADSGRPVALKVIGPELMRLPGFAERFERESRVAVTLKHPNIVDVYRAGKADGGRLGFLTMRFIEGSNLRLVLENHGKLGLEATVDIAQQVAAALDAAHARNVIHRDVKPANILIEEATGRAYLCDFGIAKDIELSSITTTGATVGSLLYLSPEQQRSGRDVDRRTDVYALGCVLYDCLAGVPATPVRDRRVLSVPLLGSPVDRVLRKAMAEDPAHRHGSCGELAEELAAAAAKTPSMRRWAGAMAVAGAGLTTALVATVAATVVDPAPDRAALARV